MHKILSSEIVKYVISNDISVLDYSYATAAAASETLKMLMTKDAFRYTGFSVYGYINKACKLVPLSEIDDGEFPEEKQVDGKPNEYQLFDIFRPVSAFKTPVETSLKQLKKKLTISIDNHKRAIDVGADPEHRRELQAKVEAYQEILDFVTFIETDDKETVRKVIHTRSNASYKCPRCANVVYPYQGHYCPECGQLFDDDEKVKPPTK